MHAAKSKTGIESKSACGIRIPKLAHKMSGFLCFPGDWKSFTKIYGIFRVPEEIDCGILDNHKGAWLAQGL